MPSLLQVAGVILLEENKHTQREEDFGYEPQPPRPPSLHPPLAQRRVWEHKWGNVGKGKTMYQTLLLFSSLFIVHVMGTPQFFAPHG